MDDVDDVDDVNKLCHVWTVDLAMTVIRMLILSLSSMGLLSFTVVGVSLCDVGHLKGDV